ncbi:SDR family NAD(P)-dependent oxidoreductase [Lysinibacter cavernae]|uniref:NAD(P)-dependent dehydrogenase (Short-subunit alcohol dehydrogenase family) n=1 Tax=Lysinibacter cavernae TaxID=1640652 RepID=A0A7X5TUY8_9MICO|nr:SDR family NAD(P)-dependent oxidoreductase [Lysinibacter cavernae]NIH54157.1 NAD(P)-dependent dehydrogenase (short-subunit alcohol dehydrogenase family) [Lysinibacter cavernae]
MTITPSRFDGKTAIVTGAGSGIGRATATRLAQEGAKVIASDVVAERLEALATELADYNVTTVLGDVSTEETAQALVSAAGGRVDVLANIAGIMDGFLPGAEVDDATWERVFNINVNSVMRLSRAVLPLMIEQGSGAIVNVASEAGLRGSAAGIAYTASKHAVIGMTKNNAVMYGGKGIRTNAVAPGAVMTNIEAPMNSQHAAQVVGPLMQVVVPKPAEAERLAAAITWLASEDSANVNGVVLASDGGWSAI